MNDIIPAQVPVSRWTAPGWALASRVDDGAVTHTRGREVTQLSDDGVPVRLDVEVCQRDELVVDDAGTVRVVREPAPVVLFEGVRLTLAQADALGRVLVDLAARCGDAGAGDETCASCGVARDEHELAVHGFVGGDA